MAFLALLFTFWLLLTTTARAAQFTPGYTFSDNESDPNNLVTSNTLYQLVFLATARSNLITDQTLATTIDTNFYTLAVSNGTFYKVSLTNPLPTAAIGTQHLNFTLDGSGLTYDGTNLAANVDTNTIQITNDVLTLNLSTFSNLVQILSTNIAQYLVTNYTATNYYVSAEIAMPAAGVAITNTHTLGVIPSAARVVLLCKTADIGYVPADEVNIAAAGRWSGGDTPAFTFWINTTNWGLARSDQASAIELFSRGGTSTETPITESRWRVKLYARP